MINIPFETNREVKYQNYEEVVGRLKGFDKYEKIGKDESGYYDLYAVYMGRSSNPPLLITASMHGPEWNGTQYSMAFLEDLRDNTFPDKTFRNSILDNYYIVYIPMVNPYGMDNVDGPYSRLNGRYNVNGVDLNRDFNEFTQKESQVVKQVMDAFDFFAYFDLHAIRSPNKFVALGNGQGATNDVRDEWGDSLEFYTGLNVQRWPGYVNLQKGLSRRYMRDKSNKYTPHTLSYIMEIARPTNETSGFVAPLSDKEIFNTGYASIYLFLKTSVEYYKKHNSFIQKQNKSNMSVVDLEGREFILQATSENEGEVNGNQSFSATILPTKVNRAFINDISEMWNVIDHDGVEHKIIYAKRRGVGNFKREVKQRTTTESYFLSPNQTAEVERTISGSEGNKLLTVEIKAIPMFFDVLDNDRIYDRYDEHMPAQRAFNRIFEGTGFTFVLGSNFSAVEWEGFGDGETKLETFKRALNRYKCEFKIVGRTVYLETQIGRDTQFMYRHRLNASNIEQEIDANEMWTYAKGYGNYEDGEDEGWETAKLVREYTSPLADIIGIRHAPPTKDGRVTDKKTMDSALKELVDESLKISLTADIHDLRKQGYPVAQSELGDRVFLIDERIGLNEEIRVIAQTIKRDWKGNILDLDVTFGSEGLSKRHQSSINTATKNINEILEGRKQLPYSVLDDAVKNATKALQDAQTELKFTDNGILAIDKNNPNLVTLFNSAGIGVSDDGGATFGQALTGRGLNADYVYTGTMLADFIAGGTLSSLNGNTDFNLNTGELDMKNAHFTLGGGARIRFTDSGNSVLYNLYDSVDGYGRLAGMGVGRSVSERYPYAYLGTYAGENMDTLGPHFSGLFVNTTTRIREDDSANSVVGRRFRLISDNDYERGLTFDFFGSTSTIETWGGDARLGGAGVGFTRGYINQIYSADNYMNINYAHDGSELGYRFDLTLPSSGGNPAFRPQYGGDYYYNLGTSYHVWRHGYINVLHYNTLEQNSLRELKEEIEPLDVSDAKDYIKNTKIQTYYYKDRNDNQERTNYDIKVGIIHDDIDCEKDYLIKSSERTVDQSNVTYLIQAVVQENLSEIDSLKEKVETLEAQING